MVQLFWTSNSYFPDKRSMNFSKPRNTVQSRIAESPVFMYRLVPASYFRMSADDTDHPPVPRFSNRGFRFRTSVFSPRIPKMRTKDSHHNISATANLKSRCMPSIPRKLSTPCPYGWFFAPAVTATDLSFRTKPLQTSTFLPVAPTNPFPHEKRPIRPDRPQTVKTSLKLLKICVNHAYFPWETPSS